MFAILHLRFFCCLKKVSNLSVIWNENAFTISVSQFGIASGHKKMLFFYKTFNGCPFHSWENTTNICLSLAQIVSTAEGLAVQSSPQSPSLIMKILQFLLQNMNELRWITFLSKPDCNFCLFVSNKQLTNATIWQKLKELTEVRTGSSRYNGRGHRSLLF